MEFTKTKGVKGQTAKPKKRIPTTEAPGRLRNTERQLFLTVIV